MKNDYQDEPVSYKEFELLFRNAMSRKTTTNNFIFGFMGMCMLILFIDFYMVFILAGLYLALVIIAPVYDPVFQLFRKIYNLHNVPLHIIKPPLGSLLGAGLSLLVGSGLLIFMGIRGMASFDFCSQSAVCVLVDLFH